MYNKDNGYIHNRNKLNNHYVEYLAPKRELNRSFLEMSDSDPLSMGAMKLVSLGWTSYLYKVILLMHNYS